MYFSFKDNNAYRHIQTPFFVGFSSHNKKIFQNSTLAFSLFFSI